MNARALLLPAFAAFALLMATPARAEDSNIWAEGVEVMSDAELNDSRGGFAVAGIEVNFGAVVTSYVDGVPVLSTNLTWTEAGAAIEETLGGVGQSLDSLSPEALAALGLGGLHNSAGVVIADAQGVTALVHHIADGALQNIVINSADGRDVRQQIDVTLELPGFELVQQDLLLELFGMRLSDEMTGVAVGVGG